VPKNNQDGGLTIEASKLGKAQVSSVVKPVSGDGYYFIRLIDINDTQVNYEYIKVPLNKFTDDLNALIKDNKVNIYISVKL